MSRPMADGAASEPGQRQPGDRMRVLLIEDEVRLATNVRRGLVAEGFDVDVTHDGLSGLWAALERPVDLVVCDIMLPGLNGYEIVRRLRAQGVWVPVLMLTAKDGEYDQADAFELGADDYLTKPFSLVVLVARLKALLRRTAPGAHRILEAGDLHVDTAARQVTRAGEPVSVTARELALLTYLLRRKGEIATKAEILGTVWEISEDADPNVVEVYIGYLRKKIDTPYGRHAIVTVRGLGYRLDPDGG